MERSEGVSTPPLMRKYCPKAHKPRRRRQGALRRFLAMLTTIGRSYALDLNGVHPQGVHSDSLESFRPVAEVQGEEKPALRAFLRAQRRQLYYMYCSTIIYLTYFILYNMCVGYGRLVMQ
jgi:hypothetical protein